MTETGRVPRQMAARGIGCKLVGVLAAMALFVAVAACGAGTTVTTPPSAASPPALMMNRYSAGDFAVMFKDAGLPLPHAHDVSQRDCPVIRCVDKIESDVVSVMTFRSSGVAELHAGLTDHSFQLVNVVMVFSPIVDADRQRAYEDVVAHALT